MSDIYTRIRVRREELGLSQEELAERMGYKSKSSINKIEMGINDIPQSKVLAFARALGTSTAYLMGCDDADDDEMQLSTGPAPDLSERAARVGFLYDRANERDRRLVDTVLDVYDVYEETPAKKLANGRKPSGEEPRPRIDRGPVPVYTTSSIIMEKPVPVRTTRTPKEKIRHRRDDFDEITVYEEVTAAGLGNYLSDRPAMHIEQYPSGMIPSGTNYGVLISGDSMEPKYKDGSTAFIQSVPVINNGEVGLFSLNGNSYIKQLIVDRANGTVRLHSLNPAYSDIAVHEGDYLYTFGRVLGSYPV